MRHVDAVSLKKKAPRKGNNDRSYNFEMEIIYEGVLDKALEGHEKT